MSATLETPEPVLAYDGRVGELYRIFLINILLSVVTLGIWRFWGVTRLRRYIWSRTSYAGTRFEYDGTGGQLFVGALLAIGILLGMAAVTALVAYLLYQVSEALVVLPLFLFYLAFLVLVLGAPFSAQRYRLSHTIWRGIRGGMSGSMITYGLLSLGYTILIPLTLFQFVPWASVRLLRRRINATAFGNVPFVLEMQAGRLYKRFLLTLLAVVVLVAVLLAAVAALIGPSVMMLAQLGPQATNDPTLQPALLRVGAVAVVGELLFIIGLAVISAGYTAFYYRLATSGTTLGGLHFNSAVTGGRILALAIGNLLILAFTLGLGLPFVIQRNQRFLVRNLLASGQLDTETMRRGQLGVSRYGEGMFQVLDAGAGIT